MDMMGIRREELLDEVTIGGEALYGARGQGECESIYKQE